MIFKSTSKITQKEWLKLLVYGSVFISIGSLAQVIITHKLFHIESNYRSYSYSIFVLFSTFLQYNMQRGYSLIHNQYNSERYQWLAKHKKQMLIAMGIAFILVIFLCNWLSWTSISIMIAAELVSTLYYLKPFNLRRFGYLKPFLIGFIWVITCAVIPLIESNLLISKSWFFIVGQFLLVSVLCVIFDIKDIKCDTEDGIRTYANQYGIARTKLFAILLSAIYFIFMLLFDSSTWFITANVVYSIGLIGAILFAKEQLHSFYYYVFVDGLLIAQLLLVISV